MNRMEKEAVEKIENGLRAAYREKENLPVSGGWQARAMNTVRHLGPLRGPAEPWAVAAEGLVWRFAGAVTAAALLLIGFYAFGSGTGLETEISRLLFGDPVSIELAQSFGLL